MAFYTEQDLAKAYMNACNSIGVLVENNIDLTDKGEVIFAPTSMQVLNINRVQPFKVIVSYPNKDEILETGKGKLFFQISQSGERAGYMVSFENVKTNGVDYDMLIKSSSIIAKRLYSEIMNYKNDDIREFLNLNSVFNFVYEDFLSIITEK